MQNTNWKNNRSVAALHKVVALFYFDTYRGLQNVKKKVGNLWRALKESGSEIRANWKLSQLVQGKDQKMKMYILIYMNTGFFLVFASTCFVSIVYILFAIIGGTILGVVESPYWFLLYLLPVAALLPLRYVYTFWTRKYIVFKEDYFKRF